MTAREVTALIEESTAHRMAGRFADATRCAEIATRLDPKNPEAWLLLVTGLSALGSGDVEKAIAKAITNLGDDHPLAPTLYADRAGALSRTGRWAEAAAMARHTAARYTLSPQGQNMLGATLAQIGLYTEALVHSEAAAAGAPNSAIAQYNLATVLRYFGRQDEAIQIYDRVLAINPAETLTYASLASMKKWTAENNHVAAIRAAIATTPNEGEAAARLNHALFKELDDLGQPEAAWPALERGAELASHVFQHDLVERKLRNEALIKTYTADVMATARRQPVAAGPKPIFIFGLPRSGTTLTERIFASHSRVTALGETPAFARAVKQILGVRHSTQMTADEILTTPSVDWSLVARVYSENIAYLAGDAEYFTEKTPQNYELAGMLKLAFPDAVLVHVRRAPMDSLFGTFRLMFGEGGYHWSYRFEDLAENYRQYRRLMDHWRRVLGQSLIEITLEDLTENPDREIRKLLARAGLPFEEACLSPEDAEGGVSTASASQVRQPINRQGVGKWRRYAKQFEPLRAMLEADGFVDANGDPIW